MRGRRHFYQVILTIESRDDIRHSWNQRDKILFETNKLDDAMDYIYTHRHLETYLEPFDDGSHHLYIQTLHLRKLR